MVRERRSVQRIRFAEPLEGRVRSRKILVLDLSTDGACIQHSTSLKAHDEIEFEIPSDGGTIRTTARVTRCSLSHVTPGPKGQSIYLSGLQFQTMDNVSRTLLVSLLDGFVRRAIQEGREIGGGALPGRIGGMPLEVWLRNKLK